MFHKNIVLFLSLFIIQNIIAQERVIPYLTDKIVIDGILDETVWNSLKSYSDFNNFYPDDVGKAKNETEVKLFHDGKTLYVSAVYHDSTEESMVSSLKRDDFYGIMIQSDHFEVVIDTYNKQSNGYYFCLNTSNAQLDGLVNFTDSGYDTNSSWSTVWKSQTSTQGTDKIYELAIPLKALSFDPQNNEWAFNFILRDNKENIWTTWTKMTRNYFPQDLRTTKPFIIENLPAGEASKFIATPSLSYNYSNDVILEDYDSEFKPSLDVQYSVTPALKLDATINPDFSQIDVDRQVTNLSRFAINLPERRNFFIENSDLFSNLGSREVNPFYSRRIGASSDIIYGLKLSGNVAPKTRVGVLNVQTEENSENASTNYGTVVGQQQLSSRFITTGYFINRQETDSFELIDDFNRIAGLNVNYRSLDTKWTGQTNYGRSFANNISNKNNYYNLSLNYSTKPFEGEFGLTNIGKNYLTDVGFVPRLYNYDSRNNLIIREGFTNANTRLKFFSFPNETSRIQTIKYSPRNNTYFDENGDISFSSTSYNQSYSFRNSSSVYFFGNHRYENLKYAFDPLNNDQLIVPDTYNFGSVGAGYNSVSNKKLSYDVDVQYGKYYDGTLSEFSAGANYLLLPIAKVGVDYGLKYLDLNELGSESFHLTQFKGEVFINNRLNSTTYLQYSTQRDNFNINSRLQWEYKPLSYIYLVVSDNYNEELNRQDWGVSFKMNYRFDF